ncbi:possible SAP domain [Synechococcus sp. RS9916]|nr:possible SAP domain [Synechococcus sp. RS9916]
MQSPLLSIAMTSKETNLSMSEEQLNAFLEEVKGNSVLQGRLKAAVDMDSVLAISIEAGFQISPAELTNASLELSDSEFEKLSGGGHSGSPCQSVFTQCPSGC